jgi:pimeloyl-ACP methyl ester carboxylesterase/predicted enzyme related to lactoylglutathione lyase
MDIILVPGLWLDGSSWDRVTPVLEAAGHRVRPITLPGLESADADRSTITLRDNVDAVVAAIDACAKSPLVVGHSAACGIVHAAVDARPDKVVRAVYIGGFPSPHGRPLAGGFTPVGADLALPDWSEFDDADLTDLDEEARARFRKRAAPSPAALASDKQTLSNPARYNVPVTSIAPEYTSAMLKEWIAEGAESVSEFARIREVEYLDLPTGHWPQFTRPDDLAELILGSVPLTAKQFAESDGVGGWRLHGQGFGAFFRAGSFSQGAAFASYLGDLGDLGNGRLDVDLRAEGVLLTLSHWFSFMIARDVLTAREITSRAEGAGLVADPSQVRSIQVSIDAADINGVLPFWEAVLGYEIRVDEDVDDPLRTLPSFWFQQMDPPRTERNRIHIDVHVPYDEIQERIAKAVEAGGTVVNATHAPFWWTLADKEGNEVDVCGGYGREEAWGFVPN